MCRWSLQESGHFIDRILERRIADQLEICLHIKLSTIEGTISKLHSAEDHVIGTVY